MKRWQLGAEPGWKSLELKEDGPIGPGPGEVLVRLRAASLNYRDTLVATDTGRFTAGRVPLSDGAGEVLQVGADVSQWKVGDRVAGTFFRDWQSGRFQMKYHDAALGGSVDGVLRQQALFPEHGLVPIPEEYDFVEASTLPCAGLTAWYSLMDRGRFQPGESVLVLGTGGVSIWALQIAIASAGRVIVTSSNDDKLHRASELGAWRTINYRTMVDWEKEVHRITEKQGVDHVIEVGGPGTLGKSLACVAAGGHIAQIGVLTGFGLPQSSMFPLLGKNATMSGIYVGSRESFKNYVRFLEATKIKPVVDRVFPFDQAREAYDFMASKSHFGKIVIEF